MKKCIIVYKDFADWRTSVWKAVNHLCKGIARILFAVVFGLWSIVYHSWKAVVKLVGGNPDIALCGFIVIAVVIWLVTFMSMRARAVGAECQRDSISWEYYQFKKWHGYE